MLVVEPVRSGDLGPVARLAVTTLKERYSPEWLQDHAHGVERGTFLVARDIPTNQIVGFALAQKQDAEGHLLALAVDSRRQGQGIGSALLEDVNTRMSRAGAMRISLDVPWDDPIARRFYARHGFYPDGLREGVYSDGGDALEMSKPL